jgi:hypothetical protein
VKAVAVTIALLFGGVAAASATTSPPLPPIPISPVDQPSLSEPAQGASVLLSNSRAGARPVTTTLVLSYQMQCGNPGPGSLRVSFPAAEQLPTQIPASAVLLNGRIAPSVNRRGNDVTITLPRPRGISCTVIAPSRVKVVFTTAARLGNPARAGSYPLSVRTRNVLLRATLVVRSAKN